MNKKITIISLLIATSVINAYADGAMHWALVNNTNQEICAYHDGRNHMDGFPGRVCASAHSKSIVVAQPFGESWTHDNVQGMKIETSNTYITHVEIATAKSPSCKSVTGEDCVWEHGAPDPSITSFNFGPGVQNNISDGMNYSQNGHIAYANTEVRYPYKISYAGVNWHGSVKMDTFGDIVVSEN